MSFFVLGVNHQTASVELREQVAFSAERLKQVLCLQAEPLSILSDIVVVSTCNRTEVYAITQYSDDILHWLADVHQLSKAQLQPHVYCYENAQAISHLMRVASGLDSLMLGEPQILGQVKTAFHLAKECQTVSKELNRIFEYVFYSAKRVRSETAVGAHAVSIGYAVAQLALQVFSDVRRLNVLLVAAGEMNSLVAKHLADLGVAKIIICNRSRERAEKLAQELAHQVQIELIEFTELAQHLHRADVVSSCTGSLHQVIYYADVQQALKQRRYQPMLLVDLAVPRDIDAKVDDLDGAYLYDVDDLQGVIDENLAQRRQAAVEAEFMVNQLATQFVTQQRVNQAGATIDQYRQYAEQLQQLELDLALQALQQGQQPDQVLQQFAYRLTQKLLHTPSTLLRKTAERDEVEYFEALQEDLQQIYKSSRMAKRQGFYRYSHD